MTRAGSELTIHKAIVQQLQSRMPDDALWFHIPNGEYRGARTGSKLKGMGVKAGAADLCVVYQGRVVFLEIKAPKGRQQDTQKAWAAQAVRAGACYVIATSSAEALAKLELCGVPIKPVFDAMTAANYRGAA